MHMRVRGRHQIDSSTETLWTHKLLDDALDERSEVRLSALGRVVQVLAKHCHRLSVGLRLEVEAPLLEDELQLAEVSDDTIVDNGEFVGGVRSVGVAVERGRLAVGGPTGVSHTNLRHRCFVEVDGGLRNVLTQGSNLADLLENQHILLIVAIDGETCERTTVEW